MTREDPASESTWWHSGPSRPGRCHYGRSVKSSLSIWWLLTCIGLAQTVAREGCSLEDAVENIDIGGPTMVRSAAKNHKDVAIVVKSSDYDAIIKEMDDNEE